MITSINLPEGLIDRVKGYNKINGDRPISISGTCKKALEEILSEAQ